MRYTDQYAEQQVELHTRHPEYGTSGAKHAEHIADLCMRIGTRDVLDYGCGKSTLAKAMPFAIKEYDPFIAGKNDEPEPADMVVCTDVLEHVEPGMLEEVLEHLHGKTKRVLFADIATRPAKKVLKDGRNAHLIIEKPVWWINRLVQFYDIQHIQVYGDERPAGLIAILTPKIGD